MDNQLRQKEAEELGQFIAAWVKNGFNATQAYQELHPNVTYASARVLGSRQLAKVNITEILAEHGLGVETYLKGLKEGLKATKSAGIKLNGKVLEVPDNDVREKYHKRLGKILGWE